MQTLDDFDLRILNQMQCDSRTPIEDIAQKAGLSTPACYRRIRALRASGAIEREIAIVAPATIGWPITMIVLVKLERDSAAIVDSLVDALRARREVMDLWYVTGDHDLVVHVAAQTMAGFDTFARAVLRTEMNVHSFETLVVLGQPERSAPLPSRKAERHLDRDPTYSGVRAQSLGNST